MGLRTLAAALLLALPAAAKEKYQAPEGEASAPEAKDHKPRWTEDPSLPKDQGWRAIGIGADGEPLPQAAADPPPKLDQEELRMNLTTLLETHLAPSQGRWAYAEKSGRRRRLTLESVGAVEAAGPDRYRARARFKDRHGAVDAELLAQLGGTRWRVLELAPARRKR